MKLQYNNKIIKCNKMEKFKFKTIALNWRWLKLLIPFWIIFGGIPLIIMGKQNTAITIIVLVAAFFAALLATYFCIKCSLLYINERVKQNQELDKLNKEIEKLNDERETK